MPTSHAPYKVLENSEETTTADEMRITWVNDQVSRQEKRAQTKRLLLEAVANHMTFTPARAPPSDVGHKYGRFDASCRGSDIFSLVCEHGPLLGCCARILCRTCQSMLGVH